MLNTRALWSLLIVAFMTSAAVPPVAVAVSVAAHRANAVPCVRTGIMLRNGEPQTVCLDEAPETLAADRANSGSRTERAASAACPFPTTPVLDTFGYSGSVTSHGWQVGDYANDKSES